MTIYFGLEFDDRVYPDAADLNWSSEATDASATPSAPRFMGGHKLLGFLEQHCGLSRPVNLDFLRTEQFRQILMAHLAQDDDATPFYAEAFNADSLATAEALLARRDELKLAAWDFAPSVDMPKRLRTFAEIEVLLQNSENTALSAGFADRFTQVLRVLEQRQIPLERLFINEPLDKLPEHWQRLFNILIQKGISVLNITSASVSSVDTALSVFQRFLKNDISREAANALAKADGSICILRCKRESTAAEYLARVFRLNPTFRPVLLLPDKSRALDNALVQEGLPSLGMLSASLARPSLQILKLVSAFLWQPVDPYKVLEFVSLPQKPLDNDLAYRIGEVMSSNPGLKSDRWNATVFRYLAEMDEAAEGDESKKNKARRIREQYNFWFERRRYPQGTPAPRADVIDIYSHIADWAFKQYEETPLPSLLTLQNQAQRIVQLLRLLPAQEANLTPLQLERVVRTVYEAAPIKFREEEAGHLPYIHQLSAFAQSTDELLWWNFNNASERDPGFPRWYKVELDTLKAVNVKLDTPEDENKRLLWQRRQAILHCSKQLFLVMPDTVNGMELPAHPLFGDLTAFLDEKLLEKSTLDLDELIQLNKVELQNYSVRIGGLALPESLTLAPMQLGQPKPYIKMSQQDRLAAREQESYTSLESLFYYPYKWVFQHKIALRKSSILSVAKESTLMGNLAHRMFEFLFKDKQNTVWNKAQTEVWIDNNIFPLLEREGATLLLYGQEPVRLSFIKQLKKAAWALLNTIQSSGWTVIGTEVPINGTFMGLKINGFADLVLVNEDGEKAIVDLKWSGGSRYRELIKNQQDLQLVMYAKLLDDDETWAHTAYFIISEAKFYARNKLAFHSAEAIAADAHHISVNQVIWEKMERTFEWRLRQLEAGKIEVRTQQTLNVLEELDAAELLSFLEMKNENARYDDYRVLINLVS